MFAIWRDWHCFPISVRVTGGNTGTGHVFVTWRDRHRLPASVSVHSDMRHSASAVFRTTASRKLFWLWACSNDETTRSQKPGLLRHLNCRNKSMTAYSSKALPKLSSMQGVYGNLAERVFDIYTAQHDAGNHTTALAEV